MKSVITPLAKVVGLLESAPSYESAKSADLWSYGIDPRLSTVDTVAIAGIQTATGIGVLDTKADNRRSAVFYRPLHGFAYGRAVWEGETPPVPLSGTPILYAPAHP